MLKCYIIEDLNKEIIGFADQLGASIHYKVGGYLGSICRHLENYLALELMSFVVKLCLQSLGAQTAVHIELK